MFYANWANGRPISLGIKSSHDLGNISDPMTTPSLLRRQVQEEYLVLRVSLFYPLCPGTTFAAFPFPITCFCTSASLSAILTDFSHLHKPNRKEIQVFRRSPRTTVPAMVTNLVTLINSEPSRVGNCGQHEESGKR